MKTTKFLLMSLCAALIMSGAVSCSKDDSGYSLGRVWRSVVTVDPIGKGGTYSLTLDDGTRLWPAGTEIPFYRPTTRHRALAYYTILSDTFQGYDHAILMRGIRDILTKPFIESDMLSTSKTSDDFGSDPISVIDIWYGDGYINVHFGANHGGTKRHLVNLVQVSQSGIPPYVFEFRHNAFGDPPRYGRRAFVAFDMAKLKFPAGSDSTVTVRVKTFGGEKRYKIVCRRSVDKTIPYEQHGARGTHRCGISRAPCKCISISYHRSRLEHRLRQTTS